MSAERLQKVLASAGIASRRECEALIAAGRVTVNGRVVQEPGLRVDPEQDVVMVDGEPVQQPVARTYIMLHKPVGYVSTADDPHGRPTVVDLVDAPTRVFPVGRLDVDSEGLILLTDDGELTHYLTHPKFEVEKEYRVLLDRPLDADALRQWRTGVLLNDELTAPAWVDLTETTEEGPWYRVVLREGRKRQIREVAKLLGYNVQRLVRVREGELVLGDLPPREWRLLTPEEVAALRAHVPARQAREPEPERARAGAAAAGLGAAAGVRAARSAADERPPRRYEERPPRQYGERPPRQYEERPPRRYDERPPRQGGGYREERPPRRYEERPPRQGGGYREERPPRQYGERPPRQYEERPPRQGGGYREERPPRRYEERPPRQGGGYREERPPRRYEERLPRQYEERPPRQGGGYREERPPRRYEERPPRQYEERPPRQYEERPPRQGGGYREERPPRRYEERPPRQYGERPPRQYGERPPRQYGERPPRQYEERPPRRYEERPPRQGGGYREERPPRQYEERPPRQYEERPPRQYEERPPRRYEERPPQQERTVEAQPGAAPRAARPAQGARRGRGGFGRRPAGRPAFKVRPRRLEDE